MARFNEILVGRYNRYLQKLLSMKGPASLVSLSDELSTVFPLFSGAENRWLEAWQKFGINFTVAAVAAQVGAVRLRNPIGSNVVAVIERAWAFNATATVDQPLFQINKFSGADLAATGNGQRFDARGIQASSLVASAGAAAAPSIGGGFCQGIFAANQIFELITTDIDEIPLAPGDSFQMQSNVVNQEFRGCYLWRERFLEDSERA